MPAHQQTCDYNTDSKSSVLHGTVHTPLSIVTCTVQECGDLHGYRNVVTAETFVSHHTQTPQNINLTLGC